MYQSHDPHAEGYLNPDTHVTFGQHKGELWTRVPISYLRWMWNNNHTHIEHAVKEMERRGMSFTKIELELSGHAIDRASLHDNIRRSWEREGLPQGIGLNLWLTRLAAEAHKTKPTRPGQRVHLGFVFEFFEGEHWPVLKTIYQQSKRKRGEKHESTDRERAQADGTAVRDPQPDREGRQGDLWGADRR